MATLAIGAASSCNFFLDLGDHELFQADSGSGGSQDSATDHDGAPSDVVPSDGASDSVTDAGEAAMDAADAAGDALSDAPDAATGCSALASGQQRPRTLGQDNLDVYWINEAVAGSPGSLMRVSKQGGPPETLGVDLPNPRSLRVLNGPVMFTNDFADGGTPGIYRVNKAQPNVVVLAVSDGLGVGFDGTDSVGFFNFVPYLFTEAWAPDAAARVRRTPTMFDAGGICYPYTAPAAGRIASLTFDGKFLYVIDEAANAIVRSGTNCTDSSIVFAAGEGGARSIGFDGSAIYWVTPTELKKLDKSTPGGSPTVLATGQNLVGLDVAPGKVVYTDAGDGTGGSVWLIDAIGRKQIGSGMEPYAIRQDQTSIYWTDRAGGDICQYPPP